MAGARDANLRVIVTGGTGLIGRPVLDELVAAGHEVHVPTSKGSTPSVHGVHWHHVDLLDRAASDELVARVGASHLIHLAWFVKPGQVWNSTENLRWVGASLDLLESFARAGGQRAVLAGSCSEYGPRGGVCVEDRTPIAPSNLYGASKAALGTLALAAAEVLELAVCWTRIFSAYGPHEHPSRLISSVARHLLLGEEAPCSIGDQKRDYLITLDLGTALVRLLESEVTGAVNVGSGEPVELRDLVARVGAIVGRPDLIRFGAVTPPPDDPPLLVADVSRLREEVGWEPRLTLDEGLELTVDWWRQSLR